MAQYPSWYDTDLVVQSKEPISYPQKPIPTISAKGPSWADAVLIIDDKELIVTFMRNPTADKYRIILRLTKKGWPYGTNIKGLVVAVTEEMLQYTAEGCKYPEISDAALVISEDEPEEEKPTKPKDRLEDLIL